VTGEVTGRVAVTGAKGRLGSALIEALGDQAVAWSRPEFDLDAVEPVALLERDRPSLVIHCAAWTDVDGCARDPDVAMRRNAHAVGALAEACVRRGVRLVVVSTNEVFDGERVDGRGYVEDDMVGPRNPYGASKLAGEQAAAAAFDSKPGLWIVRTAWLYGPPGADFPTKVVAASDRLGSGEPLPMVADEIGSPTYTRDLAGAIPELMAGAPAGGLYHLVNNGSASRFEVAERVLARCRPDRALRPISRSEFVRASSAPPWAVLDATRAEQTGVELRGWREALDEYLEAVLTASTR
jgi:dTDP-4-dehydrorhamnose reductase